MINDAGMAVKTVGNTKERVMEEEGKKQDDHKNGI